MCGCPCDGCSYLTECPCQNERAWGLADSPAGANAQQISARLERLPLSRWHLQARVLVGSATFFDGVDALAIAYVLPVLADAWHLSPQRIGLLISAGYVGQLAGALVSGWMAERIGRLTTMIYTVAVYSVLSVLCMVSWNYWSLLAFRIIQGLGLGGEVPVAATYVNELSRPQDRGRFVLLYELVFPAGRVAAALAGVWIVVRFGWRYMFLLGRLPALLVLLLRRMLPESPRWLASQGRLEEADDVVGHIESRIASEGKELPPVKQTAAPRESAGRAAWKDLFTGIYLSRTLVAWVLWFASYLILNGLSTWVPTLYRTVFKMSLQTSANYGLVTSMAGLAGCFIVAYLIDRTGRRPWFATVLCLSGLAFIALWRLGASSATTVLIYTSAASLFVNSIAMALFLYTPEIYPTRMRALGVSVSSAWLRVASILGPIVIGLTIQYSRLAMVFLEFGLVALLAALVAGLFCVETKGLALEEISV